jgi:hypothetical protein
MTQINYPFVNANQSDEGTYACTATNRVGSTGPIFKNVIIEAPPAIKNFCASTGVDYICINQSKRLSCSAIGDPLPTITISGVNRTVGDVLFIPYIKSSDAGIYTCTAFSDHGSVNKTCRLVIGVPSTPDQTFNITEGSLVHLMCPLAGFSDANVTWFLNGVEQTEWKGEEQVDFEAAVSYHGVTTCNITNSCGSYSQLFIINIAVNDSLHLTMPCSNNSICSTYSGCTASLPYQQSISLSAEARSFPTIPSLALLNPAKEKIANSSSPTTGPPMEAYRVPLMVNVSKVGKYTFHLEASTLESVVEITAEPTIVSLPSSPVILTENKPSQNLTCVALSYPCQATVEWRQGGVQMASINRSSTEVDGSNVFLSTLTVSECNEYKCVLPQTGEERSVTVDAVPMFVQDVILTYTVAEHSDVSFDCEATGCPSVDVSWNGTTSHVFTEKGPRQTLVLVRPKDSGQYSCEVKNDHGMIQRQFHLNVSG